ncbi:hypothetical protein FOXB_16856 [Fusarium oxysporum f. sp. conglutinans Fo5176]|uniref:Uncharacterized protein n=1 Tax=Fusarium oxysporum (strain Fo5176) TaxID=660025 RepID=F9GDX2_FUSOF|nr:hypothetical protein FOXB_16856 [Fusarium oxysporum f. sp. conglutinans Fo5176]
MCYIHYIFVEYPDTGPEDRMSCWKQRLQLYRGIEEGVSELEIEYDEALAKGSEPPPHFHDLSSAGNIQYWKDIRAVVQQQGDKAFVDYFDRWRALAANVFQMTQLPREEIKFLSAIVKECLTRLTLHCRDLESSMERMKQEAEHMKATSQEQKASIEKLEEEVRYSAAAFQELLACFDAGIGIEKQAAITRPETSTALSEGRNGKEEREEEEEEARVKPTTLLPKTQGIVDGIREQFKNYQSKIQNTQDNIDDLKAIIAERNQKIGGLERQLREKDGMLSQANEDLAHITESLKKRQDKIEELNEELESGKRNSTVPREPETKRQTEIHVGHAGPLLTEDESRTQKVEGLQRNLEEAEVKIQLLQESNKILSDEMEALATDGGSQQHGMDVSAFPIDPAKNIHESKLCDSAEKGKDRGHGNENHIACLGESQGLAESHVEIQNMKDKMVEKSLLIEKLKSDLHDLNQRCVQQSLEHGPIRAERDTLQSTLLKVQEAVNSQTKERIMFEGEHDQLVTWIESQVTQHRVAEESLKTLQSQQETLREELERTIEGKKRQIKDLREEAVDRLRVQEERDRLKLILCKLEEHVNTHVERKISFENGHTQLVNWIKEQAEQHHAAKEDLKTCQAQRDRQSVNLTELSSKLEMAMKYIKNIHQIPKPAEEIIGQPQETVMSLKNDATELERGQNAWNNAATEQPIEATNLEPGKESLQDGLKRLRHYVNTSNNEIPISHTVTQDGKTVTESTYRNRLLDSNISVTTLTTQIDKVLGFFLEKHDREAEILRNEKQILQMELGNIEGRLDIYTDVLSYTPVGSLPDSLSFTMTRGAKNAQGRIVGKLDLLIKRVSDILREVWLHTSQSGVGINGGPDNIEAARIICGMKNDKISPPRLCQLTDCPSNSHSGCTKSPPSPINPTTKSVYTQTIELGIAMAETNHDDVADRRTRTGGTERPKGAIKEPRRPTEKTVKIGSGRILRSTTNGKNKNLKTSGPILVRFI